MNSCIYANDRFIEFDERTRYRAHESDRVKQLVTMVRQTDTNGKNIDLLLSTVEDLVDVVNEQQRMIEVLQNEVQNK